MKVQKRLNIRIRKSRSGGWGRSGGSGGSLRTRITWVFLVFFLLPQMGFAQLSYDNWAAFRQMEALSPQHNLSLFSSSSLKNVLAFRYKQGAQSRSFKTEVSSYNSSPSLSSVPSYLDFQELGWFCTLDLKLDKTMRLPLRFRLGSLDLVNRKEGYQ